MCLSEGDLENMASFFLSEPFTKMQFSVKFVNSKIQNSRTSGCYQPGSYPKVRQNKRKRNFKLRHIRFQRPQITSNGRN